MTEKKALLVPKGGVSGYILTNPVPEVPYERFQMDNHHVIDFTAPFPKIHAILFYSYSIPTVPPNIHPP